MIASDLGGGGHGVDAAAGEDLQAEVAAPFGSFVGLLCQHRADQAHDRGPVGEDAHGVGAASDLAVEALCGVVRPDLGPHVLGEGSERQMSARAVSRCSWTSGSFAST